MSKLNDRLKKALGRKDAPQSSVTSKADLLNGTSLQTPRGTIRAGWKLMKPYWVSESSTKEKVIAYSLLSATLALTICNATWIAKTYANWGMDFNNTLQAMYTLGTENKALVEKGTLETSPEMLKNLAQFWKLMGEFALIAGSSLVSSAASYVTSNRLALRWRAWETDKIIGDWLKDESFYRMYKNVENADQRISDDIPGMAGSGISLLNDGTGTVLTLATFGGMLWGMSGSFNTASVGLPAVVIPHTMFFGAIVYAFAGTFIMHLRGKRLPEQQFKQQKYEANLRSNLKRTLENGEQIALDNGAEVERKILRGSFDSVYKNNKDLISTQKTLIIIRSIYNQLADPIPTLVCLPLIAAGKATMGSVRRTGYAFHQVQGSLSWFVSNYSSLSEYGATIRRLSNFTEAIEKSKADLASRDALAAGILDGEPGNHKFIQLTQGTYNGMSVKNLTLKLPGNNGALVENVNFSLEPGDSLILSGPSGSGKSTIVRAVRNLWENGSGEITLPENASILCSPQKPYLPSTNLRGTLSSPHKEGTFTDSEIEKSLREVGLDKLVQYLPDRQVCYLIDKMIDEVQPGTPASPETGQALTARLGELLHGGIDAVQSLSEEAAGYLETRLTKKFASTPDWARELAGSLTSHADCVLMDHMVESLAGGIPGIVAEYVGKSGTITRAKADNFTHGMQKRLNAKIDRFFDPKNLDLREITLPNKTQQRYLSTKLTERMNQEFSPHVTVAVSSVARAFDAADACLNLPLQGYATESAAGKLMLNFALNLRKEAVTGETLSKRLSGGEQQRLTFARAILQKPDIFIADEITSALDQAAGEELYRKLKANLPNSIIFSIAHNAHIVPFHKLHAKLKDHAITVEPVAANNNTPDAPTAKLG